MSHGAKKWHRCRRWWRFGFNCPFGGGRIDAPLRPPGRGDEPEDDDRDDGDDDTLPFPGAPERRRKTTRNVLRGTRDVMDLVNEVLEAMAREEARREGERVPALAMRAMVQAVEGLRSVGANPIPEAIEALLTRFAADRVRQVLKDGKGGQALAIGAGIAGGGFLINWARKIQTARFQHDLTGASSSGGFGSGGQG